MTHNTVRVRFAPSPTGAIHVGGVRTALFNLLYARQRNGIFVLRIEDTDTERSKPESERQIFNGFHWLGLTWDEGPDVGGPFGPYRQSERTALYTDALQKLISGGHAYPCFCTKEELDAERREQERQGHAPLYSGKCRNLTPEERNACEHEGRKPMYRFATGSGTVVVDDMIRGKVSFLQEHLGDFSIARSMTEPLYNLAVVVDDAAMHITHVIRGEEHLPNTPKQIVLYHALGLTLPSFAHLPLLLAPNRKKLSKRDAATSVTEYRDAGYLPEALTTFLALLGWHPKDEQEYFTFEELVQAFRLDDVQKDGAFFDTAKLAHINRHYLRKLTPEQIIARGGEWFAPAIQKLGEKLPAAIMLAKERATTFKDVADGLQLFMELSDYERGLLIPAKGDAGQTQTILRGLQEFYAAYDATNWDNSAALHAATAAFLTKNEWKNAQALWPLRIALSGQKNSPGVFDIAAILGQKETLRRIDSAVKKLE